MRTRYGCEIDYINGIPQTEATIQSYTYDSQGNPITISNLKYENYTSSSASTLSWSGRELTSIYIPLQQDNNITIEYTYNDQGYRTKKFVTKDINSVTTVETINYELIDDKVVYETNSVYGILYTYDYDGSLISFNYDSDITDSTRGNEFFYMRNQMGDISQIVNSLGQVGNIQSTNMYAYCSNNPISFVDEFGFKWNVFEILGAVALGVAVVATVALVITCPTSLPLLVVAGNGAASGIGQVVSNVTNGNPICQNVLGATVGGAISGLSYYGGGFAADIGGGIINAGINEWENSYREDREFNLVDFAYESVLYSGLNMITHTPKNASLHTINLGIAYSLVAMSSGYTVSDGFLKDFVTDIVDEIISNTRESIKQWG